MRTNQILGHLQKRCEQAYRNFSHDPKRRATTIVKCYSEMLSADLCQLGEDGGRYREKFERKLGAWIDAQSRCASSLVTGPARFDVHRNRKRMETAFKRQQEFYEWRERVLKAVNRVPTPSPEDELSNTQDALVEAVQFKAEVKAVAQWIKEHDPLTMEEAETLLLAEGVSKKAVGRLCIDNSNYASLPTFGITSITTRIRHLKKKIATMQTRIARKAEWKDIVFDGGVISIADDRVQVKHHERPSKEVIAELKAAAFRWSPKRKSWCRKHTGNALWAARRLSFVSHFAA